MAVLSAELNIVDPGSGAGMRSLKRGVNQGKSLIKCSMNKT